MNAITLPRSVLEQALEALESGIQYDYHGNPYSDNDAARCVASDALRAALEQPQVEQEPAPNGATHRQPKQGAFYKRVDGKWYVWSRMENGEPHRWYISPGTSESCLEPLNAAAPQPPAVKDSLTAEQPQSVTDCHQSQPKGEQEPVAWMFQHEETGLTELVDVQQVEWGFEKNNPRWQKIGPVYTHPQPQREPLTEADLYDIAGNYFADEWAQKQAVMMLKDHGIGGEE